MSSAFPVRRSRRSPTSSSSSPTTIGINGVGCYGSDRFKGKTPNLDALAETGLRFEQCYSMPTVQSVALRVDDGALRLSHRQQSVASRHEPSVARVLKQAGYATGMAGKWRQMADTPGDWGFDEYLTDPEASGYYLGDELHQERRAREDQAGLSTIPMSAWTSPWTSSNGIASNLSSSTIRRT